MSMMTSMYTGVSGLKTSQIGVNTSAHNLANVNTEGYVRQQISYADMRYNKIGTSPIGDWKVGLGVVASETRHIRDLLLDKAYREQAGRENYYAAQYEATEEVENILGELNSKAFQESLNELWEAVSELAKAPDNTTSRAGLIMSADEFVTKINSIGSQLNDYQANLNQEVIDSVNRINELGDRIYELNVVIQGIEAVGIESANDYRDERDLCIDELAQYLDLTYIEDEKGFVTIRTEGTEFVTNSGVFHMAAEYMDIDKDSNYLTPVWPHLNNTEVFVLNTEINVSKGNDVGKLKGLLQARGDHIADYTTIPKIPAEPVAPNREDYQTDAEYQAALTKYNADKDYYWNARVPVEPARDDYATDAEYEAAMEQYEEESDFFWNNTYAGYAQKTIEYNQSVGASVIMKTQALFDQLVNTLVTMINDVFCPNVDKNIASGTKLTLTEGTNFNCLDDNVKEAITSYLESNGEDIKDYVDRDMIFTSDFTFEIGANGATFYCLNEKECGVGYDGEIGEELFTRSNSNERYTILTADDGTKYYAYNSKNIFGTDALYSVNNLEINQAVLEHTSVLGLWNEEGEANYPLVADIIKQWDEAKVNLDPNNLTEKDLTDYYTAMIDVIANDGYVYKAISENQGEVVSELDDARKSITGVSSEEELTNLIRFQNAYNANSRFINAVAEMIDTLINRVGNL